MSICSHGYPKSPSETEIGEFQIIAFIDEEVLRLQIAM